MHRLNWIAALLFFLVVGLSPFAWGEDAAAKTTADDSPSIYLIGNSLTWDTVPSQLAGDVQWHVDCGKSLPFIYAHPEMPCVKSSTLWPAGLKEKQYDLISVQPHYGSTLKEDLETISHWLEMQPQALLVIHTGWAHHEQRAKEYADKDVDGKMHHSPEYFLALLDALKKKYPDRQFRQTHCIELLDKIAADIENKQAPLSAVADLHRDAIHMKLDSGRYLMHNAMRHALGQEPSTAGFEALDPELKKYLDKVLATLPQP